MEEPLVTKPENDVTIASFSKARRVGIIFACAVFTYVLLSMYIAFLNHLGKKRREDDSSEIYFARPGRVFAEILFDCAVCAAAIFTFVASKKAFVWVKRYVSN
jgi:hypothetical protein